MNMKIEMNSPVIDWMKLEDEMKTGIENKENIERIYRALAKETNK